MKRDVVMMVIGAILLALGLSAHAAMDVKGAEVAVHAVHVQSNSWKVQ